jgi:hypothetical protein
MLFDHCMPALQIPTLNAVLYFETLIDDADYGGFYEGLCNLDADPVWSTYRLHRLQLLRAFLAQSMENQLLGSAARNTQACETQPGGLPGWLNQQMFFAGRSLQSAVASSSLVFKFQSFHIILTQYCPVEKSYFRRLLPKI